MQSLEQVMYMVRLRQRETFKHGNQIFSRSLFMHAVTGSFSAKFSSNMKTCCQMLLCTSCLLHYCGNSAWEPRLSYWFKESTEDGDSGALPKKKSSTSATPSFSAGSRTASSSVAFCVATIYRGCCTSHASYILLVL